MAATPKDDIITTISVNIYGIFDIKKKELIKVSLDKEEIAMEFILMYNKQDSRECLITAAVVLDLG